MVEEGGGTWLTGSAAVLRIGQGKVCPLLESLKDQSFEDASGSLSGVSSKCIFNMSLILWQPPSEGYRRPW